MKKKNKLFKIIYSLQKDKLNCNTNEKTTHIVSNSLKKSITDVWSLTFVKTPYTCFFDDWTQIIKTL